MRCQKGKYRSKKVYLLGCSSFLFISLLVCDGALEFFLLELLAFDLLSVRFGDSMKPLDNGGDVGQDSRDAGMNGRVGPMSGRTDTGEAFKSVALGDIEVSVMGVKKCVLDRRVVEIEGFQDGAKETSLRGDTVRV